jgi:hypothetical protein
MEAAREEVEPSSLTQRQLQAEINEGREEEVTERAQVSKQICRWSQDPHLVQMWEPKQ